MKVSNIDEEIAYLKDKYGGDFPREVLQRLLNLEYGYRPFYPDEYEQLFNWIVETISDGAP